MEIYALDLDKLLGTVSFNVAPSESRLAYHRVVLDAAIVCDKYKVDLRIPKKIQENDLRAIEMLVAIANGAPMPASGFGGKLVKTKEHEGKVNPELLQQDLSIAVQYERLEPKPVVFGVPVDTGPLILFGKKAQVREPSEFLQRYSQAKYGDAISIGFDVSEVRGQLGVSGRPALFVKPEE